MDFATLTDTIDYRKDDNTKGIVFIKTKTADRFVSYRELYYRSLKVLYNIQQKGVKPKSELVFQVYDNERYVSIFWACLLGNIIPVPLTYAAKEDAREKIFKVWKYLNDPYLVIDRNSIEQFGHKYDERLKAIEPETLFVEELFEFSSEGEPAASNAEDIAFIQFSSGSTGDPKGVVLTHKNILANAYAVMASAGYTTDEKFLSWIPLSHDMGLIGFHIFPLVTGAMQHLMTPSQFITDPVNWLQKADQYRATILSSPNFGYQYFLKHYNADRAANWDLGCIRLMYNAAEPISVEICNAFLDRLKAHGLRREAMFTPYGLAEASLAASFPPAGSEFGYINILRDRMQFGESVCVAASDHPQAMKIVNVGKALPGSPIRITDNDDNPLEDYQIGLIQIKGPNVTGCYYNRPDKTQEIITEDGWLNTEDIGFMTGGDLFITGRAKDIIFVNGTNYYSHDIEKFAQDLPAVGFGKAAAIGVRTADNREDKILLCLVYRDKDLGVFIKVADQVRKAISSHTGLRIHHVVPVQVIPRTTSGKPQRYQLREAYLNGEFDDVLAQIASLGGKMKPGHDMKAATDAEKHIAAMWRRLLEKETVGLTDNFFDIGGTSLLAVELHNKLKAFFDCDFPLAMLYEHMTIATMAKYLVQISHSGTVAPDHASDLKKKDLNRRLKLRELRRRQ